MKIPFERRIKMTVRELIGVLKMYDQEKEVYFNDDIWGLKKVEKAYIWEYDHDTPIVLED